jgi:hypothetical protein
MWDEQALEARVLALQQMFTHEQLMEQINSLNNEMQSVGWTKKTDGEKREIITLELACSIEAWNRGRTSIEVGDPWVFCDARLMLQSEMRRLVREDMERWAREDREKNKALYEEQERREQLAKEQLNRILEQRLAQDKARWRAQFEKWERSNQEGAKQEALASHRGLQRKREVEARLAEKKRLGLEWSRVMQRLYINALNDHEYINWVFLCASHPAKRWMHDCVIVQPAV